MCSANMTDEAFAATSQESPLSRTDLSGLWQFSRVSLTYLGQDPMIQFLDTAVHDRIERFLPYPLAKAVK